MKRLLIVLFLCLVSITTQAQSVGFASLFRPGARVGLQYMPSDIGNNDGGMGYTQLRTTLIVPLGGGASLDLKNLKASAKQHFLTMNVGLRQYELLDLTSKQEVGNYSFGFTGVNASLGSGIWVYSIHAGALQDLETNRTSPFAMAGVLKVKLKGLNRQDFFGGGVIYSGKRILPVPLIGLRRKIGKKLHLTALFPVQVDLTKKLSKRTRLSWLNTFNGFATQLQFETPVIDREALFTFGSFRSSLTFQWKLSKSLRLLFEGGVNAWGTVQLFDADRDEKLFQYDTPFTPYAGVTARFNFGKSILGSQMFGNDL